MPGAGAAKLHALHGLGSLRFAILSGSLPISSSNDGINIPHFSALVNRSERGTHLFLEKHKNIAAGATGTACAFFCCFRRTFMSILQIVYAINKRKGVPRGAFSYY